jgi:hypothetical protein
MKSVPLADDVDLSSLSGLTEVRGGHVSRAALHCSRCRRSCRYAPLILPLLCRRSSLWALRQLLMCMISTCGGGCAGVQRCGHLAGVS